MIRKHLVLSSMAEIEQLPIFRDLSRAEIAPLLEDAEICVHYSDDILFQQGEAADYFGYVLSGAYKLEMTGSQGEESIMYVGFEGEALGIMGVMEEAVHFPFSAVSLCSSRFLKIPRRTFMTRWLSNPFVMLRFQSSLQKRIYQSYNEKLACLNSLSGRIAHMILYFLRDKSRHETCLSFNLTRKEIASCLGVSVEAVIRNMSQFSKAGWIRGDQGQLEVLDHQALSELAGDVGLKLDPQEFMPTASNFKRSQLYAQGQ